MIFQIFCLPGGCSHIVSQSYYLKVSSNSRAVPRQLVQLSPFTVSLLKRLAVNLVIATKHVSVSSPFTVTLPTALSVNQVEKQRECLTGLRGLVNSKLDWSLFWKESVTLCPFFHLVSHVRVNWLHSQHALLSPIV